MKTAKESTQQIREARGTRLKEVIYDNGFTQASLAKATKDKHGEHWSMSKTHLNEIVKFKRTLSDGYAEKFSDVLGIHKGYLLGYDDYKCSSYEEFDNYYGNTYGKAKETFYRYTPLLRMIGYKVINTLQSDNDLQYRISHAGTRATIPAEEMERFEEDVRKFMEKRIAWMMDYYKEV